MRVAPVSGGGRATAPRPPPPYRARARSCDLLVQWRLPLDAFAHALALAARAKAKGAVAAVGTEEATAELEALDRKVVLHAYEMLAQGRREVIDGVVRDGSKRLALALCRVGAPSNDSPIISKKLAFDTPAVMDACVADGTGAPPRLVQRDDGRFDVCGAVGFYAPRGAGMFSFRIFVAGGDTNERAETLATSQPLAVRVDLAAHRDLLPALRFVADALKDSLRNEKASPANQRIDIGALQQLQSLLEHARELTPAEANEARANPRLRRERAQWAEATASALKLAQSAVQRVGRGAPASDAKQRRGGERRRRRARARDEAATAARRRRRRDGARRSVVLLGREHGEGQYLRGRRPTRAAISASRSRRSSASSTRNCSSTRASPCRPTPSRARSRSRSMSPALLVDAPRSRRRQPIEFWLRGQRLTPTPPRRPWRRWSALGEALSKAASSATLSSRRPAHGQHAPLARPPARRRVLLTAVRRSSRARCSRAARERSARRGWLGRFCPSARVQTERARAPGTGAQAAQWLPRSHPLAPPAP